jgi:hypothetical protein
MGMLLAPLPVLGLIAAGALSIYAGRRLASRTTNLPLGIALFSLGSLGTAALICLGLLLFAVGIVLLGGSS